MNTIDFCFWLQGYFEISGTHDLSPEQVEVIKNHLSLVFKHEIDPLREKETTTPKKELDKAHSTHPLAHAFSGPKNDPLIRC